MPKKELTIKILSKLPGSPTSLHISIKDFVREKKSATEKRKSNINFLLMKLNTKPLKFKCGLADPCKAWVPPPSDLYFLRWHRRKRRKRRERRTRRRRGRRRICRNPCLPRQNYQRWKSAGKWFGLII